MIRRPPHKASRSHGLGRAADEAKEGWRAAGLDELHVIWNDAADYGADGEAPEGTPLGIVHLSYLLRVYNSAMGGGVGFAVEVNEAFRLRRAVDAMRYFGLADLAELVVELIEHDVDTGHVGSRHDDLEAGLQGEVLERAFRIKAAERPADFGLE
ncbi:MULTISPECIES: hypothetical protein [Micromonospora]|uniref:hypothetical protein n=1 Tax=Micromonospora TaxID=1873 RepID=UPI0021CA561B|nr:hypothetical protein [Micromonospora sp. Mcm103]